MSETPVPPGTGGCPAAEGPPVPHPCPKQEAYMLRVECSRRQGELATIHNLLEPQDKGDLNAMFARRKRECVDMEKGIGWDADADAGAEADVSADTGAESPAPSDSAEAAAQQQAVPRGVSEGKDAKGEEGKPSGRKLIVKRFCDLLRKDKNAKDKNGKSMNYTWEPNDWTYFAEEAVWTDVLALGLACPYCCVELTAANASMDRIDNDRHHTPDNAVLTCRTCNVMRNTAILGTFLAGSAERRGAGAGVIQESDIPTMAELVTEKRLGEVFGATLKTLCNKYERIWEAALKDHNGGEVESASLDPLPEGNAVSRGASGSPQKAKRASSVSQTAQGVAAQKLARSILTAGKDIPNDSSWIRGDFQKLLMQTTDYSVADQNLPKGVQSPWEKICDDRFPEAYAQYQQQKDVEDAEEEKRARQEEKKQRQEEKKKSLVEGEEAKQRKAMERGEVAERKALQEGKREVEKVQKKKRDEEKRQKKLQEKEKKGAEKAQKAEEKRKQDEEKKQRKAEKERMAEEKKKQDEEKKQNKKAEGKKQKQQHQQSVMCAENSQEAPDLPTLTSDGGESYVPDMPSPDIRRG